MAVHPDHDDSMQKAIRVVQAWLPNNRQPTTDEVTSAVTGVHLMMTSQGLDIDRVQFEREVQALVATHQEESAGLDDPEGHVPWLAEAKADRTWSFWERYRQYIEDVKILPKQVVLRLDQSTDRILGALEDPLRAGQWHRYGLVVGQVQSGKTGNYIGLAAKAVDAGYKLIIVLAGMQNSLRSQTQLRVDEGLLGFDSQYQQRSDDDAGATSYIGVGRLPGRARLRIGSLTTSAESGDFKRNVAKNTSIPIGDYPVVLVIKKNKSIINYVRKWIVEVEGHSTATGDRKIVRDIPLLVIDDEADNASVNYESEDSDPSTINAAIRELLNSFAKRAYVGYTATPFANIYIDPSVDHDRYGLDLFPKHFIENLPAPSNYFGPERVFGLESSDPDEDDIEPLPIFRKVLDYQQWMPDKHKKGWAPPADLPESLRRAIDSFVLTCAARRVRGQVHDHNSMLVHVTRFQDVQARIAQQVDEYVRLLRDELRDRHGSASARAYGRLRDFWERDFAPTSAKFPSRGLDDMSWGHVEKELRAALEKIQVRTINGSSQDALEYYDHRRTGLSVIAIGGDKLSRGLTLEGLSVSYYLRASRTYDTLLQMGRWFGYRPRYEDLCRLYTTPGLRDAYCEITSADNELRRDFEEMSALDAKPTEFGLRMRTSPVGLGITAANKIRRGLKVKLSYSGDIPETIMFDLRNGIVERNLERLKNFVQRLNQIAVARKDGEKDRPSIVWEGISPEEVVDHFLGQYEADAKAQRVKPAFITEYIRRCRKVGELSNWTVRLVSSGTGQSYKLGSHTIGLVERASTNDPISEQRYVIRRVLSPSDESRDLDEDQRKRALAETKLVAKARAERGGKVSDPKVPTGTVLRKQRRPDQPLLLLYTLEHPAATAARKAKQPIPDGLSPIVGFAISFPFSRHATEVEYVVNDIWLQQELDDLDGDAE
ncbi:Z1 domain-containing protein [Saccharothrix sp. S26]|uniref:Z1 domain-containing protein n=1 Tax=Saccharothrix sp. S26 TaxID=2907215 RepID=UPI001F3508AB|nr:Z1 domain-containing protein [Saccharothrix sp. S26]MCE6999974.1 Z1 domain-containing protein [Saccharothrix sp. S26]